MTYQPPIMPMGKHKGVRVNQIPTAELESLRNWCRRKEDEEGADFGRVITIIDAELEDRQGLPLELEY